MGVAIVAIPSQDDYVWKISSEKIPHMTLLFLGDITPGPELARIESFLGHVVSTSMTRFGMSVDYRGTLGPDLADVLFFRKSYSKMIEQARTEMLANPDIRQAYLSTQQFPEWTPHLTLGYPATPAHPDDLDYFGIQWINFDKIALWVGDFEGPEFRLEDQEEVALAMGEDLVANILKHHGDEKIKLDSVDAFFAHHGIKGMKWGVRRAERNSSEVTIKTNPSQNKRVKTVGGKGHDVHPDAAVALRGKQKAKASGVHTLSNEELKKTVERMNLEQQLKRLNSPNKTEAHKFVENQLKQVGQQKISTLARK